MIEITIPGKRTIKIKSVVFDVNGTIAIDGSVKEEIKEKVTDLAKRVQVYLVTADTYGVIEREMGGTGVEIRKISHKKEAEQKEEIVKELGEETTIAIGNGSNDYLMLERAVIGICVVDDEGASRSALNHSDIVIHGKETVFNLLENPKRIIATLRR
jgi:P-type E1-E2 ATPase